MCGFPIPFEKHLKRFLTVLCYHAQEFVVGMVQVGFQTQFNVTKLSIQFQQQFLIRLLNLD
jgi:hypothetical protein